MLVAQICHFSQLELVDVHSSANVSVANSCEDKIFEIHQRFAKRRLLLQCRQILDEAQVLNLPFHLFVILFPFVQRRRGSIFIAVNIK